MTKKLGVMLSYLCLFSVLAFAASDNSYSAPPFAIEIRQYLTMAIVGVVCITGGVILFIRTGHSKTSS
ncbi:MAG: hypothetical protein JO307_05720 [Bryobacterales bacterium]|nr:hypothetical protein [Bryobacterales bacterium]MBV9401811.1 hypothetical protein [Bryobacterales bacterium]